ncbi:MAG: sulfotransferase [Flavobacteriales bacterium]|nr:sulfotransferase [Flavobacteriales bacterium]NNK80593.1 sulfotransferase [Flavobacteriales bacterium]
MALKHRPFLFVGTAKAGTTSIFNYLLQHPRLKIPKKETFYFLRDVYSDIHLAYPAQRDPATLILEQEAYDELYEHIEDEIAGEIGTGYLFHHIHAIPRIKEQFGDEVNILIILRNPVDRAFSSYNHFVKDMHEPLTFEESLAAERSRAEKGWDFMWQHKALGLYSKQVEAYQNTFSNVEVLFYEDLKKDPNGLMNRIFEFIGVAPLKDLDTGKQFNPSGQPRSRTLQKLLIHDNPVKRFIQPIVRALMSDDRRERMRKELKSRNLKGYEQMSEATRKELKEFYRDDIKALSKIIERDLGFWL